MAKSIVLENIVKGNNSIDYTLAIDDKKFVLNYRFELVGCSLDFNRIENRLDPIVVTLLYHALIHGCDFRSEYPISPELLYRVTYQFVPQMIRCMPEKKLHSVEIEAPIKEIASVDNWGGIDMNCDIDSEAAFYYYSRLIDVPDSSVTHLIYFNTGAHRQDDIVQEEIADVKHFRERARRALIVINSNLADVIHDAFGDADYRLSHTFRNCGAVVILQNYFRRFYCPTAINLDEFRVDTDRDCEYYARWFLPFISTERLRFHPAACRAATRFEKLQLLSTYNYSFDTLHVCKQSGKNCGHCDDCRWTLVALDVLDMLKRYKAVFDIEDYRLHRAEYVDYIFKHRKENKYFAALYQLVPAAWKSDDCVYRLTTYHNTSMFLNGNDQLQHKKSADIKGDNYPLYARLNEGKAILFFVKDDQIKYVHDIEDGSKLKITDEPVPTDLERIFIDSIAFRRRDVFLTALPNTGNFMSRTINVVWEHYYLTEADFTYNDLSAMKNFVALDQ